MGTEHDLSPRSTLETSKHLRKETDDGRMQRKFRLFEQEWSDSVQGSPKKSHKTERSVGKLILRLPGACPSPVPVLATNVRAAPGVAIRFDFAQLRHGHAESFLDPTEARV